MWTATLRAGRASTQRQSRVGSSLTGGGAASSLSLLRTRVADVTDERQTIEAVHREVALPVDREPLEHTCASRLAQGRPPFPGAGQVSERTR